MDARPLIAHVVYRFDVGGLENGLVNIINRLAPDEFRHAIICLEGFSDFRRRLSRADVELISLEKRPGKDLKTYARLWRTLKRLAPAILHTRNFPALDAQLVGACAGVPCRVHGEHGREIIDLHGANRKHNLLRRAVHPAIHEYVTVTADLRQWLINAIGVAPPDVHHIPNGVDTGRFHPGTRDASDLFPPGFLAEGSVVVGSLSRMASVKDPLNLVRAFVQLVTSGRIQRDRIRLVMIGDGPLKDGCVHLLRQNGVLDLAWLPGARPDAPQLLAAMDLFVLPSLAEGASNTILEAMASGLPVVATGVGGTPELVKDGVTGTLVPSADPLAMAQAIRSYVENEALRRRHGSAGRQRAVDRFALSGMVESYRQLYLRLLTRDTRPRPTGAHAAPCSRLT